VATWQNPRDAAQPAETRILPVVAGWRVCTCYAKGSASASGRGFAREYSAAARHLGPPRFARTLNPATLRL